MKPTTLFLSFFTFLFLSILTISTANALVLPPQSVVGEVDDVTFFPAPAGSWSTDVNYTFRYSPSDPDQINGSFNYSFFLNTTPLGGCSTYHTGWLPLWNLGHSSTGRYGWGYVQIGQSGPICGIQTDIAMNITATNGSDISAASCIVNNTFTLIGNHSQCGNNIEAVPGVGILGVSATDTIGSNEDLVSVPALTDIRWHLSRSDTNQTNGTFDYYLYSGPTSDTIVNLSAIPVNNLSAGIKNSTLETYASSKNQRFPVYAKVLVRDPITHQRANFSCTTFLSAGAPGVSNGCGDYPVDLSNVLDGTPIFPFMNLTEVSDKTKMSVPLIGLIIGIFMVIIGTLIGTLMGGIMIGALSMFLLISLAGALNLFPTWLIVLLFLLAISLIVLRFNTTKEATS